MNCYVKLRMKNHCGESVGFPFRATLRFRQWLCLVRSFLGFKSCHFHRQLIQIILSNFSFLFFFFFVKDQIASFKLKQIFVFLKCSFCVIKLISSACLRSSLSIELNLQQIRLEHCIQLTVWIKSKKSKAILYNVDISRRYFFVCQLKIVFYFLHELKQRSSDVTGRH